MRLVIQGGKVFDPGSGWDGIEQDLFVDHGRLVSQLNAVDQVIDAHGLAVTPAAIDLRSMVAGYGQNYLRLWGGLPSPRELGGSYARLGYTHIHEPFLTLPTANYVHQELAAIPIMDTSASLTLNLRDFDIWLRDGAKIPEVSAAWAYLLENCRALNLRVVEPFINYRQDFYRHRAMSLEAVVPILIGMVESSGLHLTLETTPELLAMDLPALPGLHLGALGPALVDDTMLAKAQRLLEKGVQGDMGLMPPTSRPGIPPRPVKIDLDWYRPFDFNVPPRPEVSWRALKLALQCLENQLAFSVADSTQAPVDSYPRLLAWLAEHTAPAAEWVRELPRLNFTIQDWVRATRTLPAQFLGLTDRGHVRLGARADLALYDLPGNGSPLAWSDSCRRCRLLLKAGEVVVRDFEVVNFQVPKSSYYRRTQTLPNQLVADLCRSHSLRPENLWVRPQPDVHWRQVT